MMLEPLIRLTYTKVLVPVDCTPLGQKTVMQAARLIAGMTGAQLMLMATVPPTEGNTPEANKLREARLKHAEEAIQTARRSLLNLGYYVKGTVRVAGELTEALTDETNERHYDVIVIGTHYTRPDEPCEPTLADQVIRSTTIPVVVVPTIGK